MLSTVVKICLKCKGLEICSTRNTWAIMIEKRNEMTLFAELSTKESQIFGEQSMLLLCCLHDLISSSLFYVNLACYNWADYCTTM